jgi:hypothetical protein
VSQILVRSHPFRTSALRGGVEAKVDGCGQGGGPEGVQSNMDVHTHLFAAQVNAVLA